MRLSVFNFIVLAVTAFLAWLGTFVLECYYQGLSNEGVLRERNKEKGDQPPFPGAENNNIMWFLQISDIHLCYHRENGVAEDLHSFCSDTLDTIQPSLVLATGDLTHAKFPDERSSQQFQVEWDWYKEALERCGVREKVVWLDIRGNHDNFDVTGHDHDSNRFRLHSVSSRHHGSRSYLYTHNTTFGTYSFVAMDACPNPGPRRPFNFFGILHDEDLASLSKLSFIASQQSNQTLWFSHYPSATITSHRHGDLRTLMSSSVAHVCGHLHTLGNYVWRMYGRHPSGHLELELGDFTYNRRYRLMAYDHDLFSFTDTSMHQWPLVLITNPKDATFSLPTREPLGRMSHSTHIRLLAFSPSGIASVEVWVDGEMLNAPLVSEGPVFAVPWSPGRYKSGVHKIVVKVKDSSDRDAIVEQLFSLDGTTPPLDLIPELLLLTDFRSLMRVGFLFYWLTVLLSLTLSWINHSQSVSLSVHMTTHGYPPADPTSYLYPLVRDRVSFYSILGFLIYYGIGPWYVAEVLTGMYGVIGVHGVYVGGHFLPGSMTYLHGQFQLLFFHIPFIFYLNSIIKSRTHDRHVNSFGRKACPCCCHVTMALLMLLQLSWAISIYPYGILALLLCPGVLWPVPLSIVLVWRAVRSGSTYGSTGCHRFPGLALCWSATTRGYQTRASLERGTWTRVTSLPSLGQNIMWFLQISDIHLYVLPLGEWGG